MSDESTKEQPAQTAVENPMEELRNEFRAQFQTMKESFDSELKQLKEQNETLKSQNTELQRALVRSATVPDTPKQVETPKTEEQLYAEYIKSIADKALKQVRI